MTAALTSKTLFMRQTRWLLIVCISILTFSCKKEIGEPLASDAVVTKVPTQNGNPHIKIAVVSDIHYMAPSLLLNGAEYKEPFQTYLAQDPKLLEYSSWIFKTVINDLKAERPDILLVPGDLTKDGETVSHQEVAGYLTQLRNSGTKVYVVPGNHDINNAKAVQYNGDNVISLPKTGVADFASIYASFGYSQTERDPASLSYLAKPYKDLWILAIDASKYEEYNETGDVAGGRIKDATMTWLLSKLAEAKAQHVTLFAMMHQNLIEHYAGQTTIDPGYTVENWQTRVKELMDAGLDIIFTGHYHANDITAYNYNGKELYDIETGSLVTPLSPYRLITVKNKKLEITTRTVQGISIPLPNGLSFPAYSNLFMTQYVDPYLNYLLTVKMQVPQELATFAVPLLRNALLAHYAGDERMPPDQQAKINVLAGMSPDLAALVTTFWTDLGVPDNNTVIRYDERK